MAQIVDIHTFWNFIPVWSAYLKIRFVFREDIKISGT